MKAPTAIQKNTIPELIKDDNDAFLQAETGSGKTLAYLLPIVHRIMALSQNEDGTSTGTRIQRDSGLFAIILAPTRELCKQIATVLEKVLRCAPWIVSTTVIGGESKKSEKARLRKGVNILIATPGRLTDHLDNTKVLDVGTARWLVLDEGDRMMEMGFEEDIRTIVGKIRKDELQKKNKDGVVLDTALPKRRVTVLCSATMKMNVQKLGEISLVDAVHITASKAETDKDGDVEAVFTAPSQLKQSTLIVPAKLRLVTLIALLRSMFARRGSIMKAIIFMSCADSVDFHFDLLKSPAPVEPPSPKSPTSKSTGATTDNTVTPAAYITSTANPSITLHKLHGSLPQPVRTSTLQSFTVSTNPCVLITTDISSRGLDVPAVDLVIEYDPAFAVADHLHRIGRTARAGRPGKAVLFLLPGSEEGYVKLLHSPSSGPSSAPTPQLYDSILQKGLSSAIDLSAFSNASSTTETKRSYTARAEALQLHIEQRILAKDSAGSEPVTAESSGAKADSKQRKKPSKEKTPPNALLESARRGFRSHIRAYATHVRDERVYFDMTQLHLGHMAKAFGLREAPGGIGGGSGVARRGGAQKTATAGKKRKAGKENDDDATGVVDDDAARRMREKMKAVMSTASEFNIG
jgi:ATP-dependent RNA helicase DDX31/DBP7